MTSEHFEFIVLDKLVAFSIDSKMLNFDKIVTEKLWDIILYGLYLDLCEILINVIFHQ